MQTMLRTQTFLWLAYASGRVDVVALDRGARRTRLVGSFFGLGDGASVSCLEPPPRRGRPTAASVPGKPPGLGFGGVLVGPAAVDEVGVIDDLAVTPIGDRLCVLVAGAFGDLFVFELHSSEVRSRLADPASILGSHDTDRVRLVRTSQPVVTRPPTTLSLALLDNVLGRSAGQVGVRRPRSSAPRRFRVIMSRDGWQGVVYTGAVPVVVVDHRGAPRAVPLGVPDLCPSFPSTSSSSSSSSTSSSSSSPLAPTSSTLGAALQRFMAGRPRTSPEGGAARWEPFPLPSAACVHLPGTCEDGFLLPIAHRGTLVFAQLPTPTMVTLDGGAVARVVDVAAGERVTPRRITYLEFGSQLWLETGQRAVRPLYAVVVERLEPRDPVEEAEARRAELAVLLEQEYAQRPHEEQIDFVSVEPETHPTQFLPSTEIWLVDGSTFEPVQKLALDRFERALTVREVVLPTGATVSSGNQLSSFLVVGTGAVTLRGEDETERGRFYTYRLIHGARPVASDGRVAEFETPAMTVDVAQAVTAVAAVSAFNQHFLMVSCNQRLNLYEWQLPRWVESVTLDVRVWTVDITALQGYFFLGDLLHSVTFGAVLRDRKTAKPRLQVLARDPFPLQVAATGAIRHGGQLGLCAADAAGNLRHQQFLVQPWPQLAGRSSFRLGALAPRLLPTPLRHASPSTGAYEPPTTGAGSNARARITEGLVTPLVTGGVGVLLPMEELAFKRLQEVQSLLTNALPHVAGLNPREFRQVANERRTLRQIAPTALDGRLLALFLELPLSIQRDLARAASTTHERVLASLLGLDIQATPWA